MYCFFHLFAIVKSVALGLLRQARTLFKGVLDIEDELILVDARNESEGFETLKNVLKKQREEIIVSIVIQLYCHNVSKHIN